MSTINYIGLAKASREAAAECIGAIRSQYRTGHFTQRGVEILAIDEHGERIGDPIEYLEVKELSGKRLERAIVDHAPAQYSYICVQGGLDGYDSFQDAMKYPDDYDPMVSEWAVDSNDIPGDGERIPLEVSNAQSRHLGVADRLTANDLRAQR